MDIPAITSGEYSGFEQAFSALNVGLFGGELPDLLITLQRKHGAKGYYSPGRFERRDGASSVPELALNPAAFAGRTDLEILSTLAHEMCHHWQHCFGNPSRTGYHNREWADKMQSIGLMPSSTGNPGGKAVGQKVTHYIISGGAFETVAAGLLGNGFAFNFQSVDGSGSGSKPKRNKVKYSCSCGQNVWGKPGLAITCGECGATFSADD